MIEDIIEDDLIKWEPYTEKDVVCARFPLGLWHNIAGDINSDKEWCDFVLNYRNCVRCRILKKKSNNEAIAMIYLFNEEGCWEKVTVHGGAWGSPLMHYRGYILMIKHLLSQGVKVRTYCQLSNTAAIRFDRSVGFVPYRYTEDEVYMWISEKKMRNSKLYKRFYSND